MLGKELNRIGKIHSKIWATASPDAKKRLRQANINYKKADIKLNRAGTKYKQAGTNFEKAVKELENATKMLERTADVKLGKELQKSYKRLIV